MAGTRKLITTVFEEPASNPACPRKMCKPSPNVGPKSFRQQIARMKRCQCGKAPQPPGVVFQVHDRVHDPAFGLGTVQQVIGVGDRAQLVVAFDDFGQKTVAPSFRPRMRHAASGDK